MGSFEEAAGGRGSPRIRYVSRFPRLPDPTDPTDPTAMILMLHTQITSFLCFPYMKLTTLCLFLRVNRENAHEIHRFCEKTF